MIIPLVKFGHLLTSRELGREAFQAFRPTLTQRDEKEPIIIDFAGVSTFSPSWGDEFFTALLGMTKDMLILRHTANPSVRATMQLLEQIHGPRFTIES